MEISEVLLNLTDLETLDLSYNELTTFDIENSGASFPGNLTKLFINNNLLRHFPIEEFSNSTKLNLLDIRYNHMESFDLKILKKLESGLNLYIEGFINFVYMLCEPV